MAGIRAKMMAPPMQETLSQEESLGWRGGYRYPSLVETSIKYMPEAIQIKEESEVEA